MSSPQPAVTPTPTPPPPDQDVHKKPVPPTPMPQVRRLHDTIFFAPSSGTLQWVRPDGSVFITLQAVTGPYGKGALQNGHYIGRNLRERGHTKGMHCPGQKGWSLDLVPQFDTRDPQSPVKGRTDLRIHPLGGTGTLGCIGVTCNIGADVAKSLLQTSLAAGDGAIDVYVGADPVNDAGDAVVPWTPAPLPDSK